MLFNSIDFAVFLPIVFGLYWFVFQRNLKVQNAWLLLASYFFYGWWDWRFLSLIAFSSTIDFFVARKLETTEHSGKRKRLLWTSIGVNIGFLGVFKYFDFFAESFAEAFSLFGIPFEPGRLNLILPVGISFYTFQTLSYTIDVYRKKMAPSHDPIAFFAFVSFFPQLVAGPIERATNLLPQFSGKRSFDQQAATDGLRQILWGLFKKIAIADNCAEFVNGVFADPSSASGSTLLLGAILFGFQIYGDFSGYSDIAIGTARLFGFNLMKNFAFPYFSRDIAEFWRRWHISLSTWFRDYVYIPLGGSRGPLFQQIRNIVVVFAVSGFWHGANWTFIAWGLLNALFILPLILRRKHRTYRDTVASGRVFPRMREVWAMAFTFLLTTLAWVFFRSESIGQAITYLYSIVQPSLFSVPSTPGKVVAMLLVFFVGVEWLQREKEHALCLSTTKIPRPARWILYYALVYLIVYHGGSQEAFIYFQF